MAETNNLAAFSQMFHLAGQHLRREIVSILLKQYECRVQSGPFAGMILPTEMSWGNGDDLGSKLLGCYEADLHTAIATAVERSPVHVINVGCAEGYYTVGLARSLNKARIFAYDIDPAARTICAKGAAANNVDNRVVIEKACGFDALRAAIAKEGRTLIIMDCEGAEVQLLNPAWVPELKRCDIIVECHDFNGENTRNMQRMFATTHETKNIIEGSRDPNQFPFLRQLPSLERWLVLDESRPQMMNWLVCWAQ